MSVSDVVRDAASHHTPLIEVTGGEPLLQPGAWPLLEKLCDTGCTVLLETSGERDISMVDPRVRRIVDFKAPGSGESQRNRWQNVEELRSTDEVKFVLADEEDFLWATARIQEHDLSDRVDCILFSPVHDVLDPKLLVQWMLRDRPPARLQLQMHKYIWDAATQGV